MAQTGLHHVTAFCGEPARNLSFYTGILGLSLVKRTVNFDDPGTWHLYYGDPVGHPGTLVTFFPIPGAAPGRIGSGETSETAFRVPRSSIGWWTHRLLSAGIKAESPVPAFGETALRFRDGSGMRLALVGTDDPAGDDVSGSTGIPAEHAIRGLHGVTLLVRSSAPTAAILTAVLGLRQVACQDGAVRFAGDASVGSVVTLREDPGAGRGRPGAGSVHHVAFRAADDAAQAATVERLHAEHGIEATEQRDRSYFRSVYFREPGGVLFEIATDAPGFAVDEPEGELGRSLRLPPDLEGHRAEIEGSLPPLD